MAIPVAIVVVVCLAVLIAAMVVRRRRAHEREEAVQSARERADEMLYERGERGEHSEYGRAEFNFNQTPSNNGSEYGHVSPRNHQEIYNTGDVEHMDQTILTVPDVRNYTMVQLRS